MVPTGCDRTPLVTLWDYDYDRRGRLAYGYPETLATADFMNPSVITINLQRSELWGVWVPMDSLRLNA